MVHFTYTDGYGREVTRPIVASFLADDEHWYHGVGPVPRGAYDPRPPYARTATDPFGPPRAGLFFVHGCDIVSHGGRGASTPYSIRGAIPRRVFFDIGETTMNDDFTRRLTTVHDFVKAMNEPKTIGDVGELIDEDFRIPPEVLGQIIMTHLPMPDSFDGLTVAVKQYWLAVAGQMGPDYVAEFRNMGDFMDKVTSF